MKKIKRMFIRAFLQNKRLLKKSSFILILCLVPILVVAMSILAKDDSGILTISVCCEDTEDETAGKIINDLLNNSGVLHFTEAKSESDARQSVTSGKADAAWIFHKDLTEKIDKHIAAQGKKDPFITVIERETDTSLQLSHEKLYGSLFSHVSYSIFRNYMNTELFDAGQLSEEQIKQAYDSASSGGDIIAFERLDGTVVEESSNYLTAPLRGILSLVVVLCGIAAVMYHQTDKEHGVFDMFPPRKHILSEASICGAAVFDSMFVVVIALALSGLFTTSVRELLAALCFIPATVTFCMCLGSITKRSAKTGQAIPFVMIILLVLSPIFFNLKSMTFIQIFMPTYYYLYAIYDPMYILYMIGYSAVMLALCILLRLRSIKA